jgi:hypothetical protein
MPRSGLPRTLAAMRSDAGKSRVRAGKDGLLGRLLRPDQLAAPGTIGGVAIVLPPQPTSTLAVTQGKHDGILGQSIVPCRIRTGDRSTGI